MLGIDNFSFADLFKNLNFVEFVSLIFFALYLPRIIGYVFAFIPQKKLKNDKKNKFALVIPARNEGKTILPLLESINKQTYDRDYFDVYVIVKEKNDPVINYAKLVKAAAYVDETQTCKGDCLNYGLKKILSDHPGVYDAFSIVDADCILDADYFTEMNNALSSGADVINSKKYIKNFYFGSKSDVTLAVRFNSLIWYFMDSLGNKFKSQFGITTMTITTGIVIKSHIIEKYNGWIHRNTLTEDMEFQRDCALNDYKTMYYTPAVIYVEESPTLSETNKRRSRWMDGLTHADFLFASRLLKKRGPKAIVNNYFMFSLWILYLYVAIMIGSFCFYGICSLLSFKSDGPMSFEMAKLSLMSLCAIYTAFFIPTFFAVVSHAKEMKLNFFTALIVLFGHPFFYMGYIPIEIKAIFGRKNAAGWDEVARVQTEEVIK